MIYFIIFALHLKSTEVSTQPQHAVYKSYPQINATFCGLSKFSSNIENKCLEWHQNSLAAMSAARNVTEGEAPWTVLITIHNEDNGKRRRCTGSIIDHYWILTVAHCLEIGFNDINVYTGYDFIGSSNPDTKDKYPVLKTFIHPNYLYNFKENVLQNDIALVRVRDVIHYKQAFNRNSFLTTNICLPETDVSNNDFEYALMAGWGKTVAQRKHLQMGPRIIVPKRAPDYFSHYSGDSINFRTCTGDSGAPLWQYYMGRAVLIGLHRVTDFMGDLDEYNCSKSHRNYGRATRVSDHIQWILKTIQTFNQKNIK